jgi:hypothetical protein
MEQIKEVAGSTRKAENVLSWIQILPCAGDDPCVGVPPFY